VKRFENVQERKFLLLALECHEWSAALVAACSAQWVTWLPSQWMLHWWQVN